MPYDIRKQGSQWILVKKDGTVKSHHSSKSKAQGAERAIRASEHGFHFTNLIKNKKGKGKK